MADWPTEQSPSVTQSKDINELAEALAKAQGEITGAKKEADNPFYKSKYADLAACWDACREPLSTNGLAVIQTTKSDQEAVTVVTTLAHKSGQWIRGELTMIPDKPGPQGFGSCLTYARRYSLAAAVGLAQIDDDAESATFRMPENQVKKILATTRKHLYHEDAAGVAETLGELTQEEKKCIWHRFTSDERAKLKAMEKEIRDAENQPDPHYQSPTETNPRAEKEAKRAANA